MSVPIPAVSPAVLLSVILGAFHTCVYVLVRGQLRLHVALVLPAAIAGCWVGQGLSIRLGDPVRLGDHSLLWSSACGWLAILAVSAAAEVVRILGRPAGEPGPAGDGDDR